MDTEHVSVPLLRLFDDRVHDRALGADRRTVSQPNKRDDERHYVVFRLFDRVPIAADLSVSGGKSHQTRYVGHVRNRIAADHDISLPVFPGDQREDAAGNRGYISEK